MKSDKIIKIKTELKETYNINNDRDLINQLGLDDEGKAKLFLWVRYQCAFSEREGYEKGQEEIKDKVIESLNTNNG